MGGYWAERITQSQREIPHKLHQEHAHSSAVPGGGGAGHAVGGGTGGGGVTQREISHNVHKEHALWQSERFEVGQQEVLKTRGPQQEVLCTSAAPSTSNYMLNSSALNWAADRGVGDGRLSTAVVTLTPQPLEMGMYAGEGKERMKGDVSDGDDGMHDIGAWEPYLDFQKFCRAQVRSAAPSQEVGRAGPNVLLTQYLIYY